ncbi:MAG TPA: hypothetical protein VM940_09660, partial [Chthoniobacterales bacterium]|nr:hypothetical protein [Chthoniobacterales bacterium]
MSRHRRIVVALICAVCAGVVIAGHWPGAPFVPAIWEQEQDYQDYVQRQGRKAKTHPEFVFLGIDQTTLELPPFLPEELA